MEDAVVLWGRGGEDTGFVGRVQPGGEEMLGVLLRRGGSCKVGKGGDGHRGLCFSSFVVVLEAL